jgi:hypothetical protein
LQPKIDFIIDAFVQMNYQRLQSVYSKNGYPILPVRTGMFIEVHEKV